MLNKETMDKIIADNKATNAALGGLPYFIKPIESLRSKLAETIVLGLISYKAAGGNASVSVAAMDDACTIISNFLARHTISKISACAMIGDVQGVTYIKDDMQDDVNRQLAMFDKLVSISHLGPEEYSTAIDAAIREFNEETDRVCHLRIERDRLHAERQASKTATQ